MTNQNVSRRFGGRIALAAAGLLAATAPAYADNRVTNGNFEAGNTGFTSSYTYGGGNYIAGNYYINSGGDHTTGNGLYLNADSNTEADYFWSETFAVVPQNTYQFSVWVKSINGGSNPIFRVTANGYELVSQTAVSSTDWTNILGNLGGAYFDGNFTSVTLKFYNDNHGYFYNDLGVDDISFTGAAPAVVGGAVPEPATWGLMILGFGLAGAALRRSAGRRPVPSVA